MKDPINMFHATIGPWMTNLKFQRMFINGWGTKYIDGIHVFNNERLVYPRWAMDSDTGFVRLLKHMKAYDSFVSAGNQAQGRNPAGCDRCLFKPLPCPSLRPPGVDHHHPDRL